MLSKLLFSRTSIPDLEKSLDVYSLRQRVIANNIANVNTPAYRAKEVSFENEYRKSISESNMTLKGSTTVNAHIPLGAENVSAINPRVQAEPNTPNFNGINNVDIEHEMAELTKNNIRYEMNINLIKKKLTNLRNAISGRS